MHLIKKFYSYSQKLSKHLVFILFPLIHGSNNTINTTLCVKSNEREMEMEWNVHEMEIESINLSRDNVKKYQNTL